MTIAGREVRITFASPFGFGLAGGFLVVAGTLLLFAMRAGEARLDGWFAPLFVVTGVLAALLTMRAFAEEERAGSLELLFTAPVPVGAVVAGKVLGVLAVFAVLVAGTMTGPLLVGSLGDPDPGPIITGYVGWALVGVAFCTVGVAASAATASQLVAASATAGLLLLLWFSAGVTSIVGGTPGRVLRYLSPSTHVTGFLRGTIAAVDVVYFLSLAAAGAVAAALIARGRR